MKHVMSVATAILVAATAGAGAGATGAANSNGQAVAGEEQQMISTSEADLRRQVAIAGQPQAVLWTTERIGPANPDSFPPGPSDYVLRAVLTYGSAAEVAALVGTGPTEITEIDAPGWFPAALGTGGKLGVVRHHDVQGFMDAAVMTVPDAPGIIVLEHRSS